MKVVFRHIFPFIAAVSTMLCVCSCIYDRMPDCDDIEAMGADKSLLVIRVTPVDDAEMPAYANVTEKIRTLRVVVMNDDAIEYNKLITIDDPETVVAARFRYDLSLPTTVDHGDKRIYLIANEDSVTGIEYSVPAGGRHYDTLRELVESFEAGSAPGPFSTAMGSLYFAPDYTPDRQNALYLPYVSYYEGIKTQKEQVTEVSMYLVPVATKFTFHFINNRESRVRVDNIEVSKVDTHNYLQAHVNAPDLVKSFDGKSYYWIDWLAKVSAESHNYADGYYDNEGFNTLYGWISNYEIPGASEKRTAVMLDNSEPESWGYVPACDVEKNQPGELVCGPFYVPESRHEVTYRDGQNKEVTEQLYYLTLGLHDIDIADSEDPEFDEVVMSNLKALFRNTSMIVKITMALGEVDVYAEIADWNRKSASGWVTPGGEGPEIKD